MITRTVRIQLIAFVVIALVGVAYVGANYAGLAGNLLKPNACTINADFPDSGGIFTGAEVTYDGVTAGRVGDLSLLSDGVRVTLDLDDCRSPQIPVNTVAAVQNRSAVGEQYVDLRPQSDGGPYLADGATLPMERNIVPIPTQVLLSNLDSLVKSVDPQDLQTVVSELGQAFSGRGQDLQVLLDQGAAFQQTATDNLDSTIALLKQSTTVLQTQIDVGPQFKQWVANLNLITATLKGSDGDLRTLLDQGPGDLAVINRFVTSTQDQLGMVLANLVVTNGVVVPRLKGIQAILYIYPLAVAGGLTVTRNQGETQFGLVLNSGTPPDCTDGYEGTNIRTPTDTGPALVNTEARCTLPSSSASSIRGAQNSPGGDPVYVDGGNGGGVAYPRIATSTTPAGDSSTGAAGGLVGVPVGSTGGGESTGQVLGDRAWLSLLTTPLT